MTKSNYSAPRMARVGSFREVTNGVAWPRRPCTSPYEHLHPKFMLPQPFDVSTKPRGNTCGRLSAGTVDRERRLLADSEAAVD